MCMQAKETVATARSYSERLEARAAECWDLFYQRNADKFFRDRHYFDRGASLVNFLLRAAAPLLQQPTPAFLPITPLPGCQSSLNS